MLLMRRQIIPGKHALRQDCAADIAEYCWLRCFKVTENLLRRLSANVHSRQLNDTWVPLIHHTERERAAPPVEMPQDSTHSLPCLYAVVRWRGGG